MRIAILISGFTRTLLYNIKKTKKIFSKYECDYYLHISKDDSKDVYCNKKNTIDNIISCINPIKCIVENELKHQNKKYINMRSMWYKIYILNCLKQKYEKINNFKYDLVIRLRPDLFILDDNINFEEYNLDNNMIYGLLDEFNFGNSYSMDIYSSLFLNFDYLLILDSIKKKTDFLPAFMHTKNINLIDSKINHKLILTSCNIIALSGDSGSGKTTLMKELEYLFNNDVLKIEGDRYHKWERGDKNWNRYTHLNPEANHISKFSNDVYDLKIGNDIYQVDYDHSNGKFTEIQQLKNKKNIILCGLHTLIDSDTNKLFNLKIFLNPDEKLRRYWKIKRDISKRNYKLNKVLESINVRLEDSNKFIKPQLNESDIVIRFFTNKNFDYLDINSIPNLYLELRIDIKYSLLRFIELLNKYNIEFDFKKDEYYNFIFKQAQQEFNTIFMELLIKYSKNTFQFNERASYYTIIQALIICITYFN
jgi:uridine kinase